MIKKATLLLLTFCVIIGACNRENKKAEKIVSEWMGKTIQLPEDIDAYSLNRDTFASSSNANYKVFLYTDSTGCTSCKLRLQAWKNYIQEADSLFGDEVDFLFYFQPQNEKELQHLILRDKFDPIIYMDRAGKLQELNSFPSEMEYQCFLLDRENKVVSIGNPTLNLKIWELYKQVINE